jgi:hypothetical protein
MNTGESDEPPSDPPKRLMKEGEEQPAKQEQRETEQK